MSAKKDVYNFIREKLLEIQDVKTVRLYNRQIEKLSEESTFELPSVFFEFMDLEYKAKGKGTQEADTNIRLYVCLQSLETEELAIFDLMEKIQSKIQGLTDTINFSPLNRVSESQDIDHDNVIVWLMDYTTLITDIEGNSDAKRVITTIEGAEIKTIQEKPRLNQIN